MVKFKKGFTLLEALLVTGMVVLIIGAVAYMFQVVLAGFSAQNVRTGLLVGENKGVIEMTRELRKAITISMPRTGEVRFTPDSVTYYAYYLYNSSDPYPPQFTAGSYQIRKATLFGGINGTFTYGSGNLVTRDILPPPASNFIYSGLLITIDLQAQREESTKRSVTMVNPRNI